LKCGRNTEKIENVSGPHLKKCPHCGGKVESVITAPAIQFKGAGWYVTEYGGKKTSATDGDKADKPAAETKETPSKEKDSGMKETATKETTSSESKEKKPAKKKQFPRGNRWLTQRNQGAPQDAEYARRSCPLRDWARVSCPPRKPSPRKC